MFEIVQSDRFRKITSNNGLKDVEWGSDEFVQLIKDVEDHQNREIMPDEIVFIE